MYYPLKGVASGMRYLLNGRILGISGIYGGLIRGKVIPHTIHSLCSTLCSTPSTLFSTPSILCGTPPMALRPGLKPHAPPCPKPGGGRPFSSLFAVWPLSGPSTVEGFWIPAWLKWKCFGDAAGVGMAQMASQRDWNRRPGSPKGSSAMRGKEHFRPEEGRERVPQQKWGERGRRRRKPGQAPPGRSKWSSAPGSGAAGEGFAACRSPRVWTLTVTPDYVFRGPDWIGIPEGPRSGLRGLHRGRGDEGTRGRGVGQCGQ